MLRLLRRFGIAFGSLVAGFLVVWLLGGLVGLSDPGQGGLAFLGAVVLGALVYRDIARGEQSRA